MMLWLLFQILGGCGVLLLLEWLRDRDGFRVPLWMRLGMVVAWPLGLLMLTVFVVARVPEDSEGDPDEA